MIRQIERDYESLIPEEKLMQLPRRPRDWTDVQRSWFIEETKKHAYCNKFDERLQIHLSERLPELLLPDLIDDASQAANRVLQRLDAQAAAYRNSREADIEAAMEDLNELSQKLDSLKTKWIKKLTPLQEINGREGNALETLNGAVPKVARNLHIVPSDTSGKAGSLEPLRDAPSGIIEPLKRLIVYVAETFRNGNSDVLVMIPANYGELNSAIRSLFPYRDTLQKGGRLEKKDGSEDLKRCLNQLAEELSHAATNLCKRESRKQSNRIESAFEVCAQRVTDRITQNAKEQFATTHVGFPSSSTIFEGQFTPTPPRLPSIKFSSDVKEWKSQTKEKREYKTTEKKRKWYTLWLIETEVEVTKEKTVTVTKKGIKVQSIDDILEGFVGAGDAEELRNGFIEWIGETVNQFSNNLDGRLEEGIGIYREALMTRYESLSAQKEEEVKQIEAYKDHLTKGRNRVQKAKQWRKLYE